MLLTLADDSGVSITLEVLNGEFGVEIQASKSVWDEYNSLIQALYEKIQTSLPRVYHQVCQLVSDNPWIKQLETVKPIPHRLELTIILVSNQEIQSLNQSYRHKEGATDILTFTLASDADNTEGPLLPMMQLPVIDLGEIYVSLEWALAACQGQSVFDLHLYLFERFVHGFLHLLGIHHDTLADYNKVVAIQAQSLQPLKEEVS